MLLNWPRTRSFLEELGLDALVSSSRENTSYLTDFLSVSYIQDRMYSASPGTGENFIQVYGLLPRNGKPVLILPTSMLRFAHIDDYGADAIYCYGKSLSITESRVSFESRMGKEDQREPSADMLFDTPGEALRTAISDHAPDAKIGIDYSDLAPQSKREIKRANLRMLDATELFRLIRMVKSPDELARLSRSATVNEKGMSSMINAIRPGVSEIELMKTYGRAVAGEGARFEPGSVLCLSGPGGSSMMNPTERKMKNGDLVWIDVICNHDGYFSDTGETVSIGRPGPEEVRVYETMKKVIERAEDISKPGMRPSELSQEVGKIWDAANLTKPPVMLGHGIGLEAHEYPPLPASPNPRTTSTIRDGLVHTSSDIPLEKDMVLNLESGYFVPGWGGIHLERTIVIGTRKNRRIVEQIRNLRLR